jgi:hypothetical protein
MKKFLNGIYVKTSLNTYNNNNNNNIIIIYRLEKKKSISCK